MTNPTTTLPPLPDWLDVEAGEIHDEQLSVAALLIAGLRRIGINIGGHISPHVIMPPFDADRSPHACIARWAGEDAERWDRFGLALLTEFGESAFDGYQDDLATTYALCNAKPHQLYRALVNVAWNPWRAEYNKRREAAGGAR